MHNAHNIAQNRPDNFLSYPPLLQLCLSEGRGRLGEVAVKIITVIEFRVNDGGGSAGGCCGIVVRADTAKMTNMTTAVFGEKMRSVRYIGRITEGEQSGQITFGKAMKCKIFLDLAGMHTHILRTCSTIIVTNRHKSLPLSAHPCRWSPTHLFLHPYRHWSI